jgi:molybdate transport system substrate-binding protein
MAVPGADIVGPFPAPLQTQVVLTAGIGANTKEEAGARALIESLTAPGAASVIRAKGLEPI